MCAVITPVQDLYPQLIHSARGVGTFCAISGRTADIRDNLVSALRNNGMAQQVLVGYQLCCVCCSV